MTVSRLVPLSLPHTMPGGANIDLRFSANATVGVQLDHVQHDPGGTPFNFITTLVDSTVTGENLDGRLWEVGYTLRPFTTEGQGIVSPADATTFEAWDASLAYATSPDETLLFIWRGIPIPGARDEDSIAVTMRVTLANGDNLAHVSFNVTRERGASASVDYIEGPILWLKGPALPNGAESHSAGQVRSRVLIPTNSVLATPTFQSNSALSDLYGQTFETTHPNPYQQLQFAAVVSMNNIVTPDPAFRRIFWMGSEDVDCWHKKYEYRGYNYTGGGADDGYFRMAIRHYPPFQQMVGDESGDDWRSNYSQPYDCLLGALTAADDHFWYDCADFYRTHMESIGFMPPKIESNPRLTSALARSPSLFFPTIDILFYQPINRRGDEKYQSYLDICRPLRRALYVDAIGEAPTYLHMQTWLLDFNNVANPGFPLLSHPTRRVDDGLLKMIEDASQEGIRTTAYTNPTRFLFEEGRVNEITNRTMAYDRDGNNSADPNFGSGTGATNLDDASPHLPEIWNRIWNDLTFVGIAGVYLDAFAGKGSARRFPPYGVSHTRNNHGDARVNKTATIDAARAIMRANEKNGTPRPDNNNIVLSEIIEETMIGVVDWLSEHHSFHTTSMLLAEEPIRGAVTNISTVARNMQPELTTMVYHEYQPVQRIAFHAGTPLLATNPDWQPSRGKPGLSASEFIDLYCWAIGTNLSTGARPADILYQNIFDGWDQTVTSTPSAGTNKLIYFQNGQLRTDPIRDPTGAGITIVQFLKTLYEAEQRAYAGQFTMFGRYERPILVDHSSPSVTTVTCPARVLSDTVGKVDRLGGRDLLLPFDLSITAAVAGVFAVQTANFQVPAILASMWQSPEGVYALLLVNWTTASADWIGTFDPAFYSGLTLPYDVDRLVLGGAPISVASGVGAGAVTIGTTGATPTIDIGTMPAHSVAVITFT